MLSASTDSVLSSVDEMRLKALKPRIQTKPCSFALRLRRSLAELRVGGARPASAVLQRPPASLMCPPIVTALFSRRPVRFTLGWGTGGAHSCLFFQVGRQDVCRICPSGLCDVRSPRDVQLCVPAVCAQCRVRVPASDLEINAENPVSAQPSHCLEQKGNKEAAVRSFQQRSTRTHQQLPLPDSVSLKHFLCVNSKAMPLCSIYTAIKELPPKQAPRCHFHCDPPGLAIAAACETCKVLFHFGSGLGFHSRVFVWFQNYVSCKDPSGPPLTSPELEYEVLKAGSGNMVMFPSYNGFYIFKAIVVDPTYRYQLYICLGVIYQGVFLHHIL